MFVEELFASPTPSHPSSSYTVSSALHINDSVTTSAEPGCRGGGESLVKTGALWLRDEDRTPRDTARRRRGHSPPSPPPSSPARPAGGSAELGQVDKKHATVFI